MKALGLFKNVKSINLPVGLLIVFINAALGCAEEPPPCPPVSASECPEDPAEQEIIDENAFSVLVDASCEWTATGFFFEADQRVEVFTHPDDLWDDAGCVSDADGAPQCVGVLELSAGLKTMGDVEWMTLVGRVGEQDFAIGTSASVVAEESGELLLHANDVPGYAENNGGCMRVYMTP